MAESICSTTGCGRTVRCRGLCARHYDEWIRTTTPEERASLRPTTDQRFAAKVEADGGCLIWTGALDPRGYGRFGLGGRRTVFAHRYALERSLGRPIADGMLACHTCDRPSCVNPDHLYEGTDQDNVDDMTRQERHAWGERNGHHKLSFEDVTRIRRLGADGFTHRSIAKRFGIHQTTVSRIISAKRWRLAA